MQRPPSARRGGAAFAPIFGFLAALRTGEIWCTDAGAAIMPVWGGELCAAGPALDGWISCWQRIVDGERLDIDLQPLRTLHAKLDQGEMLTLDLVDHCRQASVNAASKLEQGEMLTLDLVDHCRQVTYACRRAYGRMPRARAKSYSLTELIAVEVEECGLAGDAAGESGAAR